MTHERSGWENEGQRLLCAVMVKVYLQGFSWCNIIWKCCLTDFFFWKLGSFVEPFRCRQSVPQVPFLKCFFSDNWRKGVKQNLFYRALTVGRCGHDPYPSCHSGTANTHVYSCIINSTHYYFISLSLTSWEHPFWMWAGSQDREPGAWDRLVWTDERFWQAVRFYGGVGVALSFWAPSTRRVIHQLVLVPVRVHENALGVDSSTWVCLVSAAQLNRKGLNIPSVVFIIWKHGKRGWF